MKLSIIFNCLSQKYPKCSINIYITWLGPNIFRPASITMPKSSAPGSSHSWPSATPENIDINTQILFLLNDMDKLNSIITSMPRAQSGGLYRAQPQIPNMPSSTRHHSRNYIVAIVLFVIRAV